MAQVAAVAQDLLVALHERCLDCCKEKAVAVVQMGRHELGGRSLDPTSPKLLRVLTDTSVAKWAGTKWLLPLPKRKSVPLRAGQLPEPMGQCPRLEVHVQQLKFLVGQLAKVHFCSRALTESTVQLWSHDKPQLPQDTAERFLLLAVVAVSVLITALVVVLATAGLHRVGPPQSLAVWGALPTKNVRLRVYRVTAELPLHSWV